MSNTQKLTAAMVAAYPNAKVLFTQCNEIFSVSKIDMVSGFIEVQQGNKVSFWGSASRFQLVLASPDNVSDEQALEVAKRYYDDIEQTVNSGKELINIYKRVDSIFAGIHAGELQDICRSLSIDMGYMGIPSLITAGLAVEAEKA